MEPIIEQSIDQAKRKAVKVWAFTSGQYPLMGGRDMQIVLDGEIVKALSAFAANARRSMGSMDIEEKFPLKKRRWMWEPSDDEGEKVGDLKDALNRIIHARKMEVGFENVPSNESLVDSGAICVPYVRAETDRFPNAFIDLFSISYAYLFEVAPKLSTRNSAGKPG